MGIQQPITSFGQPGRQTASQPASQPGVADLAVPAVRQSLRSLVLHTRRTIPAHTKCVADMDSVRRAEQRPRPGPGPVSLIHCRDCVVAGL